MKFYQQFFVCLIIINVASCAKFKTLIRIKPKLEYSNGLLISNSQVNPYKINKSNDGLKIDYKVIVKNILQKETEIDLSSSSFKANEEAGSLDCKIFKRELKKMTLSSDEQIAIQCSVTLIPNHLNKLMLKDTDVDLSISLNSSKHNFSYRVYAEEFN